MAAFIAYTTSTGQNYGLFNTHDRAARFGEGVLMSLEESEYVSIKLVRSTGYDTWLGDNIGFSDAPAQIHLRDQFGKERYASVGNVLSRAADLDAYGLTRIVLALRACSDQLHPSDLAAWRAAEDQFPIFQRGEVL